MAKQSIEYPIKGEIYSLERLEEYAAFLAGQLKLSDNPKVSKPLLPRMRQNQKKLLASYRSLTEAIHRKDTISPAGEWLTDNFHIVEDQLREIQEDLPPAYYKELPKLAVGDLTGYPRIYAIALALVAHTDSQLDAETIRRFIQSFQLISPLSIGELWALPITLRLVLVENLSRTSSRIVLDHERRNFANHFADKLFEAAGDSNKSKFNKLIPQMASSSLNSVEEDSAYLAQVAKRLRDQEPELWPALEHLEKVLSFQNVSAEQVVHLSHNRQASYQVTVANIITSMRLLSSLNWRDFFESVSVIDKILADDPIYKQMDFVTRDQYRHVIENISKQCGSSEFNVASEVVKLAREGKNHQNENLSLTHVGYYLTARGLVRLKERLHFKLKPSLENLVLSFPHLSYFGILAILLVAACSIPILYSLENEGSAGTLLGIFLLILIPCSEPAISILNVILTNTVRPKSLPKLDFSKGVPVVAKTMVVIPCMLSGKKVIQDLLEKMEVHHLGNSDEQITYALLTDYTDSAFRDMPADAVLLKTATDGIARLNQKYKGPKGDQFFLFHRQRKWNLSENTWMGWERKRGKIHEFNRLLRGDKNTSFVVVSAPITLLPTIRYIITLDADTQLPRDSARRLIGTIMHPLNQPRLDKKLGRVTEGYAILQPRIGISIESSARSLFAKVFSGYTGIDPYTTAVSEVYQDLFFEGSYTGKGLYAVDAFEAALEGRIPENTILSHDLFEGLYCRAALVTDIELLDDYPQSYRTFFTRQHRWSRGDWQIGPWIFPFVLNAKKEWVRNHLPLLSRWKIVDNLRRSLVAPSVFLCFLLGWTLLPGKPLYWSAFTLLTVVFPILAHFLISTSNRNKYSLLQGGLFLIFIAHQAYIQLDAIVRVFYRRLVSKKKMLEWATAAHVEDQKNTTDFPFWQSIWATEAILLVVLGLLFKQNSEEMISPIILVLFWMSYPIVGFLCSRKLIRKQLPVDLAGRLILRQVARRTWHYFETFVGPEDNWLPPDNHQQSPNSVTAHRTSPTNIGLYMLSLVSARDFGYINSTGFMSHLSLTLSAMQKLERHKGHYLNWYNTNTLAPLNPKYISTVDSGNLAGYLLVGRQACLEVADSLAIDMKLLQGLNDIISVIEQELDVAEIPSRILRIDLDKCRQSILQVPVNSFSSWNGHLKETGHLVQEFKNNLFKIKISHSQRKITEVLRWTDILLLQLQQERHDIAAFAPWVLDHFWGLGGKLEEIFEKQSESWNELLSRLDKNVKIIDLPLRYEQALVVVSQIREEVLEFNEVFLALTQFIDALIVAKTNVNRLLNDSSNGAAFMEQTLKEMDFGFLLVKEREVFSIGYNVTEGKFDSGLYDLLGSESRLASFVAIAKGDVSQEHWFRLGRQLVPVVGERALVSWTASMFEYLMPLLVMRDYENTLLDETIHTVVTRQINYGNELNVPWGVSEAGYNARDLQLNYQYGPFGVPGLGLKRGLSHDLVVSPYSTLLAAMVNSTAALENIKRLTNMGLLCEFGFYESIDYTAERLPENEKFAIVKSFMAHHQGMSLVAINNVVNDNSIQERFHLDQRIQATRLLLQERIPHGIAPILPKASEIELEGDQRATTTTFVRHYTDPNESSPRIQLLSNRTYSLMISTAGAGYSKCRDLAVTRWREDSTRDNFGSYIFVKDCSRGKIWSTTYQPFAKKPDFYKVTFGEEKVEFRRRDKDVSTYTQIIVAPEDNVEIRHVTLHNHSDRTRVLELTSYLEPVLGPAANDLDHQTFSKLFIQTEYLPSKKALLATRRKRSDHDQENWGLHVVVTDATLVSEIQYETDREKFIGRGRSLPESIAFGEGTILSNTSGSTLDPILSLRVKIKIPGKSKVQVAFTTGLVSTRQEALELADRYHDIHSFERESQIAWTKSQVDMRHLNIDFKTAYLCQRLAERILFSEPSLRPPSYQRAINTNIQSSLWPSGISGDLPIVVVKIKDQVDVINVRMLLRCHEYLRLKGLIYDFVILNEHETTYFQDLQEELVQQIRGTGSIGWLNKPGGIFILRKDLNPKRDMENIQSVARVLLSANEPLKEQIRHKALVDKYPEPLKFVRREQEDHLPLMTKIDLEYFNGLGGFSVDGQEYITILQSGQWTPAPWINVVGNNKGFGFQISETGSGFTWSINSQTNRLSPWSNDPVCDPPGEIIYLRDDETGEVWNPTPLPIRDEAPYRIRHGQGYSVFEHSNFGISSELTVFVAIDEQVKISILKFKNLTNRRRKISITSYTELVLGSQREKTAPYLVCDVDLLSTAIFARNPHDNEFATKVTFADIGKRDRTFTCSRKEFIGRNGNYIKPEGLLQNGLSGKRGTGQDPCAVLQTCLELEPDEVFEMSILLGQSDSMEQARELSYRYRNLDLAKAALKDAIGFWNELTGVVQVKTPEPAMNLMMNKWLLYQTLSCRYWSRTAFYQSGGAYGFRDQLQDCMAFVYASPGTAREHILRASERQFKEGDVQHWWHPPTGRGIRTRMTDDLLWLPYVVCFYVRTTGDKSILREVTPFLEAPILAPGQEDSYSLPLKSTQSDTLFEHCLRAITYSMVLGEHDLPMMGTGDWNDGMNRVGSQGKGESIWLGWFFYKVLADFQILCDQPEHAELLLKFEKHKLKIKTALDSHGWDGSWYKRAFFDDGTPLGSKLSQECRIDSISQSWAVLSGAAPAEKCQQAMEKVIEYLVKEESKLILLLTPPFDKWEKDPGYIKGYIPGVRENGGQYTHAAIWVAMAFAELGDGNLAFKLFNMLNPILHSSSKEAAETYSDEAYVMAGDVYAGETKEGRGGWSWYTGSAAWYYRAGLESILGFHKQGNVLCLKPHIPKNWLKYEIEFKFGKTQYSILVLNPHNLTVGDIYYELDGVKLLKSDIMLVDDGIDHNLKATLRPIEPEKTTYSAYNDQSNI